MTSILIVDEDEVFARSLKRGLVMEGHDVDIATSVQSAWDALASNQHDVVLTELHLGPHSGLELIRAIHRAHPSSSPVLMSGTASARDYQQAVKGGCTAFLVKPFSSEELREAVQQALTLRTGFRGSVHGLTLTDMLQMFHFGRRTLEIQVRGKTSGYIRLRDGEVIDAASDDGNLRGMIALRHLLSREQGVLNTGPLPDDTEQTLAEPFDFLLMDAIRENDEAGTPVGVQSARPPRISWSLPATSNGNAALATHLSLVPMPANESVRRQVPIDAPLERAVEVVSGWLTAIGPGPRPQGLQITAVACAAGQARLLEGPQPNAELGEPVAALLQQAASLSEDRTGFVELVREGLAVAIGWDLDEDAAVVVSRSVSGPAECAKFRGHASILRRVVTRDL